VAFDFFSLAVVTLAAFLGAVVASKLGQSVILGYLVVGIALGEANWRFFMPQAGVDLVGSPTVKALADLGIAFLLFFVGLEFSVRKLKNAGKPSTILAFVDYGVLLFSGFLVGAAFGWGPVESLFLGGILAMSSLGIAAKSLIELKRLDSAHPETEVLLGSMVVENFLSMILLTISVGWVAGRGTTLAVLQSVQGAAVIYGSFLAQEYRNAAFDDYYGEGVEFLFDHAVRYAAEDLATTDAGWNEQKDHGDSASEGESVDEITPAIDLCL